MDHYRIFWVSSLAMQISCLIYSILYMKMTCLQLRLYSNQSHTVANLTINSLPTHCPPRQDCQTYHCTTCQISRFHRLDPPTPIAYFNPALPPSTHTLPLPVFIISSSVFQDREESHRCISNAWVFIHRPSWICHPGNQRCHHQNRISLLFCHICPYLQLSLTSSRTDESSSHLLSTSSLVFSLAFS